MFKQNIKHVDTHTHTHTHIYIYIYIYNRTAPCTVTLYRLNYIVILNPILKVAGHGNLRFTLTASFTFPYFFDGAGVIEEKCLTFPLYYFAPVESYLF
jgi:hypothetical protein